MCGKHYLRLQIFLNPIRTIFSNGSAGVVDGSAVLSVQAYNRRVILARLELRHVVLAVNVVSGSLGHAAYARRQQLRLRTRLGERVATSDRAGHGCGGVH